LHRPMISLACNSIRSGLGVTYGNRFYLACLGENNCRRQ
jgi:hypothetical protein